MEANLDRDLVESQIHILPLDKSTPSSAEDFYCRNVDCHTSRNSTLVFEASELSESLSFFFTWTLTLHCIIQYSFSFEIGHISSFSSPTLQRPGAVRPQQQAFRQMSGIFVLLLRT